MEPHARQHRRGQGKRASGLVMAGFGTLWWLAGAGVLPQVVRLGATMAGLAFGVTLIVLAWRRLSDEGEQARFERHARQFTVINITQGVAIAAVIAMANMLDAAAWIPAVIAIVVGVHFLPLARLFDAPEYRWTAALMTAAGLAGIVTAISGSATGTVLAMVGTACACILWGTASWYLRQPRFVAAGVRKGT